MIALIDFQPLESKWLVLVIVAGSAAGIYVLVMSIISQWWDRR